jgi:hypothetical protein
MKRARALELLEPEDAYRYEEAWMAEIEKHERERWGGIGFVGYRPSWIGDAIRVLSGEMPRGRYWPLPRFLVKLIVDTVVLATKLQRRRTR